ncbi:hypothetical protein [Amycolatopsis lurida]|uniref:hypothetical protein n=1 Tax=Amycolatopsis lurida TaxID=31959 RepID=UPI001300DB60|nr:hypothetical protein [Amycolatopsis lurida]
MRSNRRGAPGDGRFDPDDRLGVTMVDADRDQPALHQPSVRGAERIHERVG